MSFSHFKIEIFCCRCFIIWRNFKSININDFNDVENFVIFNYNDLNENENENNHNDNNNDNDDDNCDDKDNDQNNNQNDNDDE